MVEWFEWLFKKKMDGRTHFHNLISLNQILYDDIFQDKVFMGHCILLFRLCNTLSYYDILC